MRERGHLEIGIYMPPQGFGCYFFNRNNGNFSTGIDTEAKLFERRTPLKITDDMLPIKQVHNILRISCFQSMTRAELN